MRWSHANEFVLQPVLVILPSGPYSLPGKDVPPLPLKKFCYPLVTSSLNQSFEQSTKTLPEQGSLGTHKNTHGNIWESWPHIKNKTQKEAARESF